MNTKSTFYCLFLVLSTATIGRSQIVNFQDAELKRYFIEQVCIDTAYNGVSFSNDLRVDTNGDQIIQQEEAENIHYLQLNDLSNSYHIQSLADLNAFPNLKYLKVISLDELTSISQLQLDSLHSLWISDGVALRVIDISNLPGITEILRIEGLTKLDTLNIQNGTVSQLFSLFYSFNIKYACIDSIAAELDQFQATGAMLPGIAPSFDCGLVSTHYAPNAHIQIYPNPASHWIHLQAAVPIKEIIIHDQLGKLIF
ncbi:MAG: hypothetical protein AAF798_19485, partial [Bacteroidota bacterium]